MQNRLIGSCHRMHHVFHAIVVHKKLSQKGYDNPVGRVAARRRKQTYVAQLSVYSIRHALDHTSDTVRDEERCCLQNFTISVPNILAPESFSRMSSRGFDWKQAASFRCFAHIQSPCPRYRDRMAVSHSNTRVEREKHGCYS